jgi:molybdopterin-guanine dinucleotide biosynthesis protein A
MPRKQDGPAEPSASPADSIAGAILAGGRGARMGGADKGWVTWQGRALVEHVYQRLRPQVEPVLISANRNLERYRALGAQVVADDVAGLGAYCGPLAGMLAALEQAPTPWIAVVPCDAPQLPMDLVARLTGARAGQAPVVARCGARSQPVFCLLPRTLAPALRAALIGGERSPQNFLRQSGAVEVEFADAAAFTNINCAPEPEHVGDERT